MDVSDAMNVARGVVEGFSARDEHRLISLFSPDAEFFTRVQVLDDRHFQGHDAVRDWLRTVNDEYDRFDILDADYTAGTAGCVLVDCRLSLRFKGDSYGQSRAAHWVICSDEEQGTVTWFKSFAERQEAERAAGLSE